MKGRGRRVYVPQQQLVISALIFDRSKNLLLLDNNTLPEGHINWYESPEDAVRRIVWEQTGLTIAIDGLLPLTFSEVVGTRHILRSAFYGHGVGAIPRAKTARIRFATPTALKVGQVSKHVWRFVSAAIRSR